MYHSQGKLIVSKGVGLKAPPKAVTYVAKPKKKYKPKQKEEWKAITTNLTLNQDSTGSLVLLNGCTRGGDIANREGRQINMRSVEIKLQDFVTSGTGIDQNHRILLVLDKQPNGVAPAIADILDSASTYALRNLNNRKRFKILWDKRLQMNASGEPFSTKLINKYKKFYIQTTYNAGDVGTIADIATNSLYLIGFGNVAPGATAGSCNANVRVRFTE